MVWRGVETRTVARSSRPAPSAPGGVDTALVVGQLVMVEPTATAGRSWPLGNEITLGRSPSCGVHLDDTFVSGVHARIFNASGTFMVEDLDSRNGTLHNGTPLDFEPGRFLDLERAHILCTNHGALFRIEDGYCVSGPCAGKHLEPAEAEIRSGFLVLRAC